ncbi:helix-turn-helix domain-containing protein [Myxococcus faecalis]|uniref:helix-turn-helix domain-containing protein n=1 Tax=Myxococcus faecalis TaxID=3115646 RepID=UPI003CEFF97E
MKRPKFTAGYSAAFRLVDGFLELLERRGMTRADLARRLDVKRSAVSRWFSPNRNLTVFTAAMIAEALGAELRFEFVDIQDNSQLNDSGIQTESVQGLPDSPTEYRKVTPVPASTMDTVVTTVSVSIPRFYERGIETDTVANVPFQLHNI